MCTDLTFYGAETRHFLGHQRPVFVFAVDFHYLLPTLASLCSGKSRDGFLPADLTLRLLLPRLQPGRQQRGGGGGGDLLRRVKRWILIGPLRQCRDGWQLWVGFTDVGAVVIVPRPSGLDGRVLEDCVCRFSQHTLRLGFIQFAFGVCDWHSLALGSRSQVAVAVDGVEVFGDGVLIVVAVQAKFLFRPVGVINILSGKRLNTYKTMNIFPQKSSTVTPSFP